MHAAKVRVGVLHNFSLANDLGIGSASSFSIVEWTAEQQITEPVGSFLYRSFIATFFGTLQSEPPAKTATFKNGIV